MATIRDFQGSQQDDETDPQLQGRQKALGTASPRGTAAQGALPGVTTTPSVPRGAQAAPSSFVSFDRYLAGNKQSADKAANKVNDDLQRQGLEAERNLGDLQNSFSYQAKQGGYGDAYKGPTDFSQTTAEAHGGVPLTVPEVEGSIRDESAKLNATKSNAGVGTLLQPYTKGTRSQGQKTLDSALVGRAGQKSFADTRNQFQGIDSWMEGAYKGAAADVAAQRAKSGPDPIPADPRDDQPNPWDETQLDLERDRDASQDAYWDQQEQDDLRELDDRW